MMTTRATTKFEQATRLTGRKDDYGFEMWVEIEGTPVEVYDVKELDDGTHEGWFISEIDEVSSSFASEEPTA
jgi:hypothetical protein